MIYMREIPITLIAKVCPNGRFIQNKTINSIANSNVPSANKRVSNMVGMDDMKVSKLTNHPAPIKMGAEKRKGISPFLCDDEISNKGSNP